MLVEAALMCCGWIATMVAVATSSPQPVPAREVVYNHVRPDTTSLDTLILETYGDRYEVRELRDVDGQYVPPRLLEGGPPGDVVDDSGKPIAGYVLSFYLITTNGRVREPLVVTSTDPRLEGPSLQAIRRARFKPATWNGETIPTIAAQEFVFDDQ